MKDELDSVIEQNESGPTYPGLDLQADYGAISEQTVASAETELGKLRSQHQEFGHSMVQ